MTAFEPRPVSRKPLEPYGPSTHGTTIPTLMIAGEFDPNARPAASRGVAELIGSHVQWIEFAEAGHSVRSTNPCAAGIVAAFIEHPTQPVEASCATRSAPIRFLPP